MFKKISIMAAIGLALSGCFGGGSAIKPMSPGDKAGSQEAVLVGKVVIRPAFDKGGKVVKSGDKTVDTYGSIKDTSDKSRKTYDKDNNASDSDLFFGPIQTGQFFAVPVGIKKTPAINQLQFTIYRSSGLFTQKEEFFSSSLMALDYHVDQKLEAGKVYYAGTIVIDLGDNSFEEMKNQQYNKSQVLFVVPKNIAVSDEFSAAKEWYNVNYPNGAVLSKASMSIKPSGVNNYYRTDSITHQVKWR
jgi:hypothetical protein